jgi:acyl dehydratase
MRARLGDLAFRRLPFFGLSGAVDAPRTYLARTMPFDQTRVGHANPPSVFAYTSKDVILYALGVGAKHDELDFLYEGRGPKVLPSFAVIPTLGPVFDLLAAVGGNLAQVVHGGQRVVVHAPIPPSGTLTTTAKLRGIYDLRKFATALVDTETRNSDGAHLFDTSWSIVYRGEGGFGGAPPPREELPSRPDRAADFSHVEPTTKEQALLYRLNGDLNPLHADPAFAALAGFPQGPILHGLCTFGHLTRAVVKHRCGGDPTKLKSIEGQFRKPVWPGDTIVSDGWALDDGRLVLSVSVKERADVVFGNAMARVA